MYEDPLVTPQQNELNRERLRGVLANSTINLTSEDSNTPDDQFIANLMQHCTGLRALESYDHKQA